MAETTELEKKREAERRLALLALTGEQPAPGGSCLDCEELAALVEGRLAPEQIDACLAHIAACERCYFQWRQLDREWQQQGEKSRPGKLYHFISQSRFLAAAGSFLAAAASIAVFLTITTRVDRTPLTGLPEQPAQEQRMPSPPPEPMREASQATAEKGAPPPASSSASRLQTAPQTGAPMHQHELERKKEKRSDRIESQGYGPAPSVQPMAEKAQEARQDEKALPAPTVTPAPAAQGDEAGAATAEKKGEERVRKAAGVAGTAGSAATEADMRTAAPQATVPAAARVALPTLNEWRSRIRQGCQGQPGADFFTVLSQEGRQLLRESASLKKQERRQLERILAVLGTEQPAEQRCHTLLELLGPAGQGQER